MSLKNVLALISMSVVLTACGGGSGSGSGSDSSSVNTVVGGVASKGLIAGGTVNVYAINADGTQGTLLGTGTTASDGTYSVDIGSNSGDLLVEVTGGSYTDEATGNTVTNDTLRAAITDAAGSVSASVTAFTEVAVQKAGALTSANIVAANSLVSNMIGGVDILLTSPANVIDSSSTTATDAELTYGLMLASISQFVEDGAATDVSTAISTITADLSDSILNTTGADLITALVNFMDSSGNNLTGLASNDASLTIDETISTFSTTEISSETTTETPSAVETWFGSSYAIENSIRAEDGDDNPQRVGATYDSSNKWIGEWQQDETGSSYAYRDLSLYNLYLQETITDSRANYVDLPAAWGMGQDLLVYFGGYMAEFDLWSDENGDGLVDSDELRSRIGIFQSGETAPYSVDRPDTQYDFATLLAGNTYSGITITAGDLTDPEGFTVLDGSGGCSNTITFGASVTADISGSICFDASTDRTITSEQNLFDPAASTSNALAANHGVYGGGTAYDAGDPDNAASIAIVASPDGKAVVVATCMDTACDGHLNGDVETLFDFYTMTDLSGMRYSILTLNEATLTEATLTSIVVTATSDTVVVGMTQQLAATGHYENGTSADITNSVEWTSLYPDYATVDQNGLVTAGVTGPVNFNISATIGEIVDYFRIYVSTD